MNEQGTIVLLAGPGPSTNIVYRALAREFDDVKLVVEDPVPRTSLLRRRVKRLGLWTVVGQVLFMTIVVPLLKLSGSRRIEAIKREFALDDAPLPRGVHRVPSVNSPAVIELLGQAQPRVVVVNGTRIITSQTLAAIDVPVINLHAGITPLYRGVHGGYWALAERRPDLVGTTVHLIDEGIDTGGVISQATFPVTRDDSFVTYPYLHVVAGLPSLVGAIRAALNGGITPQESPPLPSKLRSHPTLWSYCANRVLRGAR